MNLPPPSLVRAALSASLLVCAIVAKADTYTLLGSHIDYGTYQDQTTAYVATANNEVHRFTGEFKLLQQVTGSPDPAPWSSPFATLTSVGNSISVSYDMSVTIPNAGLAAWVYLNETTQDGWETWSRFIPGSGSGGGGETGGTLPRTQIDTRNRTWYSPNGSPGYTVTH